MTDSPGEQPQGPGSGDRRIWLAVVIVLAGVLVAAVGVVLTSWWVAVTGAVVAAAGAALARRYRIMRDVQVVGDKPVERQPDRGPGGAPDAVAISPAAAEATHRPRAGGGAVGAVAGWVLVAVGGWLFVSQWVLGYAFTESAVDASLRDGFLGVVVGAAGVAFARSPALPVVALTLAAVTGVLLLALPLFTSPPPAVSWNESLSGAAVLGCALVRLAAR
jgi:hypothetical protein